MFSGNGDVKTQIRQRADVRRGRAQCGLGHRGDESGRQALGPEMNICIEVPGNEFGVCRLEPCIITRIS